MYTTLLFFHSLLRWLVLGFLTYTTWRAYTGCRKHKTFSSSDNTLRHWTATITHIQLVIGVILYIKSPVIQSFWQNAGEAIVRADDPAFFGMIHLLLMLTAVILITVGAALAKRKQTDQEKFTTLLTWFGMGLFVILIAIPWPFSPLAGRPYFRTF